MLFTDTETEQRACFDGLSLTNTTGNVTSATSHPTWSPAEVWPRADTMSHYSAQGPWGGLKTPVV